MDKKKVIKLIGNVEKYLLAYEESGKVSDFSTALQQLHEAEDELSKPDWISVEDELPKYGEEVFVRISSEYAIRYSVTVRDKYPVQLSYIEYDENHFVVAYRGFHVTHWCKIDKLEV